VSVWTGLTWLDIELSERQEMSWLQERRMILLHAVSYCFNL
jgi:hypothetical protein